MNYIDIAIIGAGFSGMLLAEKLSRHSNVHIFEKSRGIGGRLSTKYTDYGYFNHGAPYFTARGKAFKTYLKPFVEKNILNIWKPKIITLEKKRPSYKRLWFENHYRTPGHMCDFVRAVYDPKHLHLKSHIVDIKKTKSGHFELFTADKTCVARAKTIINTAPLPQSVKLYEKHAYAQNLDVTAEPRFTLLVVLAEGISFDWDVAHLKSDIVDSMICENRLNQKSEPTRLVIHSHTGWATKHLEDPKPEVEFMITKELSGFLNISEKDICWSHLHRWRYQKAFIEKPSMLFLRNSENNLFIVGDGFGKGRLEDAFESVQACVDHLL